MLYVLETILNTNSYFGFKKAWKNLFLMLKTALKTVL